MIVFNFFFKMSVTVYKSKNESLGLHICVTSNLIKSYEVRGCMNKCFCYDHHTIHMYI